jgi:hypothetical protein
VDRGQLGIAMGEVLRGKALRVLAEQVKVTDEAGRPVDISEIAAQRDAEMSGEAAEEAEEAGDADGEDSTEDSED